MLNAHVFLMPQHIPHRERSNRENDGSQDVNDSCSLLYTGRCSYCSLRFEVLTAVRKKIPAFWDLMLCSLLAGYQKLHGVMSQKTIIMNILFSVYKFCNLLETGSAKSG